MAPRNISVTTLLVLCSRRHFRLPNARCQYPAAWLLTSSNAPWRSNGGTSGPDWADLDADTYLDLSLSCSTYWCKYELTSPSFGACSRIRAEYPIWLRAMARSSPRRPAPTMIILNFRRLGVGCSLFRCNLLQETLSFVRFRRNRSECEAHKVSEFDSVSHSLVGYVVFLELCLLRKGISLFGSVAWSPMLRMVTARIYIEL